jgi:hypothetical protein
MTKPWSRKKEKLTCGLFRHPWEQLWVHLPCRIYFASPLSDEALLSRRTLQIREMRWHFLDDVGFVECLALMDEVSWRQTIWKRWSHLIVASSFFPGHQLPAAIILSFPGFTNIRGDQTRYDSERILKAYQHWKTTTPVNFNHLRSINAYIWSYTRLNKQKVHGVVCKRCSHPAKIPFRPLLEKLAETPFLYGVLSLLNRI